MILSVKLISVVFCYYDGHCGKDTVLTPEQKSNALVALPSLFDLIRFVERVQHLYMPYEHMRVFLVCRRALAEVRFILCTTASDTFE